MIIAITGSRGFIGSAVTREAEARGHQVIHFDRADGNDVLGDLRDMKGAERVIHLAGVLGTSELFVTPEHAIDVNIKGTLRVLQWCRVRGAGYTGVTLPDVFHSVYTATKVCADRLTTAWHEAFGVPTSTVRAFNVYGVGQKWGPGHPQKFLPTFAMHAWAGKPIPIWGDGTQTMDVVSTGDLARMLLDACNHGDNVTFDAGCGEQISVNDFADFVLKVTGSTAGAQHLPMRIGEVPSRIVAAGEGWDRLGWRPRLLWGEVQEAIESYREPALRWTRGEPDPES